MLLLFAFQDETTMAKPLVVAMIAVPLILPTYGIFVPACAGAKLLKLPHNLAGPAYLIGASNFFELAEEVAISVFGLHCGAALATVVSAEVKIFYRSCQPLPDDAPGAYPQVTELRAQVLWAEGMVWCLHERHGAMTGIMKSTHEYGEAGRMKPSV